MDRPTSPASTELVALLRNVPPQEALSQLRERLAKLDKAKRHQQLQEEDEHGNTALLLAVMYEYPNVASLLLQCEETDPMHANSQGVTALSLAARTRRPFVVSAVLHRLLSVDRLERGELVTYPGLSKVLGLVDGGGAVSLALARQNLVDLLAELSLDALSRCVVRAFKRLPGKCLYDCIELAAAIQLRSRAVHAYDAFRADELEAASARLQLAVAGCLTSLGPLKDGLGRFEVDVLLQTPLGEAAIKLAIRHSCKHFLSQPPVQALLTRVWRGPLFDAIVDGTEADFCRHAGRYVVWLLAALANLLLLPLIAAYPPLERQLVGHLKRDAAEKLVSSHLPERRARGSPRSSARFSPPGHWQRDSETTNVEGSVGFAARPPLLHYYLLRVPMLKYALRLASDVALAICVTFQEGEPSPWVFLVWPLGGLLSEYLQLIATDSNTPTLYASVKNEVLPPRPHPTRHRAPHHTARATHLCDPPQVLSWVRSDTPSTYRDDLFNVVDMLALHLLLASEIAYYAANEVYLPLRAFAVLALDVRLLRLIYLSPKLGALVLLLVRMTIDLLKLFVLLAFAVFALVSALYVVEGSWQGDEHDKAQRTPACDDFYILGGSWTHWGKLLFLVMNAVVDGRAQDALFMCVLHEENSNRYLLWLFTYLMLLFVVVLLLNMLIAMFSRSFDMMYDSMATHVQTHFARAVVAWCANAPEPPPLTLLQVPYLSLSMLSALARPCLRRCCPPQTQDKSDMEPATPSAVNVAFEMTSSTRAASQMASTPFCAAAAASPTAASPTASSSIGGATTHREAAVVTHDATITGADASVNALRTGQPTRQPHGLVSSKGLAQHLVRAPATFSGMALQPAVHWLLSGLAGNGREATRDYEGTTVPSMVGVRNSWEIWREKMSEESLTHEVADFVAKREDTLAQEERWRNKMMRRLGDKFEHVDARLDGLSERVEQLTSVCAEIRESVRGVRLPSGTNRSQRFDIALDH